MKTTACERLLLAALGDFQKLLYVEERPHASRRSSLPMSAALGDSHDSIQQLQVYYYNFFRLTVGNLLFSKQIISNIITPNSPLISLESNVGPAVGVIKRMHV